MDSKDIYDFEKRFDARVRRSQIRMAIPVPISWQDDSNDFHDLVNTTETVSAVEIVMTEGSFKDLLELNDECESQDYRYYKYMVSKMGPTWMNQILNQQDRDIREIYLRNSNPAVKAAWEQYRMLLKLVE